MRITGGTHRSRKLETPKNNAVRPTSDKVRQAVFNMLHSRGFITDAVVVDAFCGTGALGLEALSQGASYCTFFDKSKDSIALTKQNIQSLKEEERSKIIFSDATKVKEKPEEILPASLVFLDPPYNKELVSKAIDALMNSAWLQDGCAFVIETEKHEVIGCDKIEILNEKIYSDTKITLAALK